MFEMTEADFSAAVSGASQEEHEAVAEPVYAELRTMRVFFNAAVEAAVERARAGEAETARRALDALERIAEVSARPDQLAIGRLVAEKLSEQVAEARAEIAALGG